MILQLRTLHLLNPVVIYLQFNCFVVLAKTFVKNNLVFCITSIVLVVFVLGYFIGIEVEQDTVRQQELKNLEQRLDELKNPEISLFFQISKDDDPVLGDLDAPISVIEFSNFQCKFCLRFYSDTLPLLKTQYIDTGKVKSSLS